MKALRLVIIGLLLLVSNLRAQYAGGDGSAGNPYRLASAADLIALGINTGDYDKHFRLIADIDLAGYSFSRAVIAPLAGAPGSSWVPVQFSGPAFRGTFDGYGHRISNLTIQGTAQEGIGLFGGIDTGGQVRHLDLTNVSITGRGYVGGLAGILYQGRIDSCYVSGSVAGSTLSAGGLVGLNYTGGSIMNCHTAVSVYNPGYYAGGLAGENRGMIGLSDAMGPVEGNNNIGGLVGSNYLGVIELCRATGSVNGNYHVGGLAGNNTGEIESSYATGKVKGERNTGGLVGSNGVDNFIAGVTISRSYATGEVTGGNYTGGLAGLNIGDIQASYSGGRVEGVLYVGGLVGYNDRSISDCYAFGLVRPNAQGVGGLVGVNYQGIQARVLASFYDRVTTGQTTSSGGTGLSTAQMQAMQIYVDGGWDFSTEDGDRADWFRTVDDYPKLSWQSRLTVRQGPGPLELGVDELATLTVTIGRRDEGGPLSWSAGIAGESWLYGVSPAGGVLSNAAETAELTLSVDTTGLAEGRYETDLVVWDGRAQELLVPIQLVVMPRMDLKELAVLSRYWLTADCFDDPGCVRVDRWLDGQIDPSDLAVLAENWLTLGNPVVRGGLISHWPFDSDGRDVRGKNPGVLTQGAAITVESDEVKQGAGALKLDGVDDSVDCGTDGSISHLSTFSVAMWIKADAITAETMQMICQRDLTSQMWGLSIWGSQAGHLTGFVGAAGNGATSESAFTPKAGQWTHVVMTYDDQGDRKVRIYVDGMETPYVQQSAAIGAQLMDASIPVLIGNRVGGGRAFGGGIDEVRIYRRILDGGEIAELSEFEPFAARWAFDTDGSDSQGSNHGTLLNGAAITAEVGEVRLGTGALKLDGVDDFVDCGTDGSISHLSTFSVAMWIKADAITAETMQMICQRDLTSQMWGLSIWGSQAGHLTGYVGAAGSGATSESVFTPKAGQWTHVVMTYDDLGDRKVRLYVDGMEMPYVQQSSANGVQLMDASIPVLIGNRVGGGRAFGGGVDEVRIYRRILDGGEIAELSEFKPFAARWAFDTDGSDSQGSNHGTLVNGAAITAEVGEVRLGTGALKLDGVDDSVDCGTGGSISHLSTFSVALWFKADAITANTMQLICQRDLSSQMWGLSIWGSRSGHLTGYVSAAGVGATAEATLTPTAGQWTHVAMTYDDLGDRKVRLYVDGVERGYVQQTVAVGTKLFNAAIPVTIGNWSVDGSAGGKAFGGGVDEVRIFRRVLSVGEIAVLAHGQ